MDDLDKELMYQLQRDFPIDIQPFKVLSERLSCSESEIIERTKRFFDDGKARRLGAVFDAIGVGYKSALCGVAIPDSEIDEVSKPICEHIGVTHCYVRGWPTELDPSLIGAPKKDFPNVWFTFAAERSRFDEEMAKLQAKIPYKILVLPALQRFKIDVVFDPRQQKSATKSSAIFSTKNQIDFSEQDKLAIRLLQKNLPIQSNPFKEIAEKVGVSEIEFIEKLKFWKEQGALRRIAMILYHRSIGFSANAMCVWNVAPENIAEVGKKLAARPEITHCYERALSDEFPFNVYAMIHRKSWDEIHKLFCELNELVGGVSANLLGSMRELKKVSPYYFGE